jgi:predicted dehydrogenase
MKKLRVAVIGAGYLGQYHAQKYARMPDVELVGVADIDVERADEVASQYATKAFYRYQDLLGQADAASIVVPTPAHHEVSKAFLSHNTDLLIEKPMTSTLDEADELIELAETHGLILQVGHLERFNPAVVALRDVVKKPMFIEAHRLSIFNERGTDVSVVLDLMIHDIDIIVNYVRSEITNIHATGIPVTTNQVDIANARIEFATGCVANVTTSRVSMKNERKIRLFQKDGYISVDFGNRGFTRIYQDENASDGIIPGMAIQQESFPQADALDDELKSFIRSVQRRVPSAVSGADGRNALAVALTIMEQIDKTRKNLLDKL